MLAEGRPLVDNVFSLYEGVLRLELDRPTYERCGLQGSPIEDGGKKHQKARWGMSLFQFCSCLLSGSIRSASSRTI
jgi:ribonuclease P/MRP protein subunit RPP40